MGVPLHSGVLRSPRRVRRRPLPGSGLLLVLAACVAGPAAAQEGGTADWRALFQEADQARRDGAYPAYARVMAEAVAAMPEGHLNRPFAQYHAARAHALMGDADAAVDFLRQAWEEDIEALMISFARHDTAFDSIRHDPGFREAMAWPQTMELEVTHLSGGSYLIRGAGSSVVASVGPDGVLLVDTGYAPAAEALRRALSALGGRPITRVVLTHPHEDHWGGAEIFGPEAEIWAHPGTAAAMEEPYTFMEGVTLPPRRPEARPEVEVAADTAFRFNGQQVRVFPVPAHTGADLAVWFEGDGVLHLGDAYLGGNPMMFPGAEDPDGFLAGLEARLRSLPAGTVVVGGHDPPTGVRAVLDQIDETRACMALVRRALAEGDTLEEAVEQAEGRFAAPWVAFFYRALSG